MVVFGQSPDIMVACMPSVRLRGLSFVGQRHGTVTSAE
jgi:hypothetical protein